MQMTPRASTVLPLLPILLTGQWKLQHVDMYGDLSFYRTSFYRYPVDHYNLLKYLASTVLPLLLPKGREKERKKLRSSVFSPSPFGAGTGSKRAGGSMSIDLLDFSPARQRKTVGMGAVWHRYAAKNRQTIGAQDGPPPHGIATWGRYSRMIWLRSSKKRLGVI